MRPLGTAVSAKIKSYCIPTTHLTLALLCVFFVGVTLEWLRLDRAAPHWDDSWYLSNSLVLYDSLVEEGFAGYVKKFLSILEFKAPLITALPTPFYMVLGRRWHAAYLVNVAAMLVLFGALYRIGARLWHPRAGLIAVCIAGTMPLLYGLSRWYLVEYSLSAVVAVAIALLLRMKSDCTRVAPLFGIVCGLGLLLKVSFPLFVLPAFLVVLWRHTQRMRLLGAVAVPCLLIAGPWYLLHFRRTIDNAVTAGWGYSAIVQGTGSIFSLNTILLYAGRVLREGPSLYYAVMALFLLAILTLRGKLVPFVKCFSGPELFLLAWAAPFFVFMFGGNKDVRYIAPILPSFALGLAFLTVSALDGVRWANVTIALLFTLPFVDMFQRSFGLPVHYPGSGYVRLPDGREWAQASVLQTICRHTPCAIGQLKSLLIATDRATFNANNFELAVTRARLPFSVSTTAYERNLASALALVDSAYVVVYKEGGEPESPFFNQFRPQVVQHLREGGQFSEIPYQGALPDGGIVRIFRKNSGSKLARGVFVPVGLDSRPDFSLQFGGLVSLDALSFSRTAGSLEIRYRWRCLRPVDREYWCFTHVLDSSNQIAGYLDHRILNGEPPMVGWHSGDVASEELRFPLPVSIATRPLWLRVGLYHVPTGERLRVAPLALDVRKRFSLVDEGTALVAEVPP